ncbi:MAG: hypothetical protein ABIJ59_17175 [Pseudomonadota bacterium]
MKQYHKIMALCMVGWCLTLFSGSSFFNQINGTLIVGQVFAADEKQENSDKNQDQKSDQKSDQKDGEKASGPDEAAPCPECPECPDPAKVVLRGLEEKKTMVEKEQKIMLEQKKQLQAFEEQIDEKIENLEALKKQIAEDMALLDKKKTQKEQEKEATYETQMRRLVKTYESMKPKAAAPIIDKMNLEVAQEIFLRMKEAAASQILSFVDSEKAAKISERLAFKRK